MNTGKTGTRGMAECLPELTLGKGHPIPPRACRTSRAGFAGPSGLAFFFSPIGQSHQGRVK